MNETAYNKIIQAEYIGLPVKIVDANNKAMIGIEGIIVDETRHTLMVATAVGTKQIIKKGAVLQIIYKHKKINIKGDVINKRPEERIKLK